MFDFAVIGAGVVGSMIARELARYENSVIVLEKEEDVSKEALLLIAASSMPVLMLLPEL